VSTRAEDLVDLVEYRQRRWPSKKMPPARPRPVDDSRSETSSTIGNIKERNALLAATGAGVSKSKRAAMNAQHSTLKPVINGVASGHAAAAETDPSLPRVRTRTSMPSKLPGISLFCPRTGTALY
jgi:hypothetical protein